PPLFLLILLPPPPTSTLFPYTTLFRSRQAPRRILQARLPLRQVALGHHHRRRHPDAHVHLRECACACALRRDLPSGFHRANHRRSEEHTSELQSPYDLVCRLLLEKKKT